MSLLKVFLNIQFAEQSSDQLGQTEEIVLDACIRKYEAAILTAVRFIAADKVIVFLFGHYLTDHLRHMYLIYFLNGTTDYNLTN